MAKLIAIPSDEDDNNNNKNKNKQNRPNIKIKEDTTTDEEDDDYEEYDEDDEEEILGEDFCEYHQCSLVEHDSDDFASDTQSSSDIDNSEDDKEFIAIRTKEVNEKNGNNIYQSDCFIRQLSNYVPNQYDLEFGENYTNTIVDSDQDDTKQNNNNKAKQPQQLQIPNKTILEISFSSNKSSNKTSSSSVNSNNKVHNINYVPTCQEDNLFQKHYKTLTNSKNIGVTKKKNETTNTTSAATNSKKKEKEEEGYGNFYNDYCNSFQELDNNEDDAEDEFILHNDATLNIYKKRELIPTFTRDLSNKSCIQFINNPNQCFHPQYREVQQGFHWCENRSILINNMLKKKLSKSSVFNNNNNSSKTHPLLVEPKDHSICKRLNNIFPNGSGGIPIKQNRHFCWENSVNSDTEDEKRLQETIRPIKSNNLETKNKKHIDDDDSDYDDEDEDDDEDEMGNEYSDYDDSDYENSGPVFNKSQTSAPHALPVPVNKYSKKSNGEDEDSDNEGPKNNNNCNQQ